MHKGQNSGIDDRPEHIPEDVWDAASMPQQTLSLALDTLHPNSAHIIRCAISMAIMSERSRAGGARAVRFQDKLVVVHPDMPAHIWDGEKIRRMEAA